MKNFMKELEMDYMGKRKEIIKQTFKRRTA